VWRPTPIQTRTVQSGEAFGFAEQICVGPDLVAKPQDRALRSSGVTTVPSEKGGDVRSGEGNLAERRGEDDRFGHGNKLRSSA
jgi:predicted RecA/RadA family phage recombinase